MIKLLIADDHQLFIDGLRMLLEMEPHIQVVGQALNGEEVLEVLGAQEVDIVLLDINMPDTDPLGLVKTIRAKHRRTKVIILTMYHGTRYYTKLIRHGINGYLYKSEGKTVFLEAIEKAVRGETYISKELLTDAAAPKGTASPAFDLHLAAPENVLTKREIEILKLVAQEYSNQEIGEKLFISTSTVDTHRKHILLKLGVRNTVGLVKYCLQNNLLDK
ncbi:MAG TPA: response regulator transcription factor [Cytophagales bacterium]|jgi:DNA-binding NarL/FixJ family response regulator